VGNQLQMQESSDYKVNAMSVTVDGFVLNDGDTIPRALHNAPAVFRNFTTDITLKAYSGGSIQAIAGTTPEFYRFINAGDSTAKPKVTIKLTSGNQILLAATNVLVDDFTISHGEEWLLIQEKNYYSPSIALNVTAASASAEPIPDPLNVNNLNVSGTLVASGNAVVQQTLAVNETLAVKKTSGFVEGVTMNATLEVDGVLTAKNQLIVDGAITAKSGLAITGQLGTSGDFNVGGKINCVGDAWARANLEVDGELTAKKTINLMNPNQATAGQPLLRVGQQNLPDGIANSAPQFAIPDCQYVGIGGAEYGANSFRGIGFGYVGALNNWYPAMIGYQEKASTQETSGDLVFLTRSTLTNIAPTERLRITAAGVIQVNASMNANGSLDIYGAATFHDTAYFSKAISIFDPQADQMPMIRVGMSNAGAANIAKAITDPKSQYIAVGGGEKNANSARGIGFGFVANGATDWHPATIMYQETNTANSTSGDLVLSTRPTQTNVAPSERLRITANGVIQTAASLWLRLPTAPLETSSAYQYLNIGGSEKGLNTMRGIGLGYGSTDTDWKPAYIGFTETDTAANTQGDIVFMTRPGTTNVAPTERLRIDSHGDVRVPTYYVPGNDFSLATKKYVDSKVTPPALGAIANLNTSPAGIHTPGHNDTVVATAGTNTLQLPLITPETMPDGFEFKVACANTSGTLAVSVPTNSDGIGFIKLLAPADAVTETINLTAGTICHFKVSNGKYVYYSLTIAN
jgi:hypothetical protein